MRERTGPPTYRLKGYGIEADRPSPGLYVVATPIGHLDDVTLRALETLAAADIIACEDTRVTGRLLARYDIATPTIAYNDHNAPERRPGLLARLAAGDIVALVSDAGTPLVSDPGYRLVREAHDAGIDVVAVPGATAVMAALVTAGLPTDTFLFVGFLPPKRTQRRKRLTALAAVPSTLVVYEAPSRLAATLADMAEVLGDRQGVISREITKKFEEHRRGSLADLATHYAEAGAPRGELVVVVGPPLPDEASPEDVDRLLGDLLATQSVSRAAQEAAAATGLPRRDLYRRALALSARKT